ncbi:MAG: nucleotidyl transferase AbiEii/AbiGii toxin family protein [Verrucomicrobia bacterium]|nr:nucleotidyl transferase AbiEii/AbiGii toxin family protein [Verrucomicrobiota bacterium]
MNPEPRHREDYSPRQIEAARRVLVDVGQVLASFADCLVVIGGWVPDLLLPDAEEPHIGSIDVDLALDAAKLTEGRYAELLKLLLDTKRYRKGAKDFQLVATVDLKDGEKPVEVEVEFLAPKEVKLKKNKPKLLAGFRVLQADACAAAFRAPVERNLVGKTVRGARNTVRLRVASLADFLVMKAHALAGRDKPKDAYDICYCLEAYPGGMANLAAEWRRCRKGRDVAKAIEILSAKFASVDAFGPQQLVEFHSSPDAEMRAMQARRAFELVHAFLELV